MKKRSLTPNFKAASFGIAALAFMHAPAASAQEAGLQSAVDWYKNIYAVSYIEGDPNFYDHYMDQTYLGFGANVGYLGKSDLEAEMTAYVDPWIKAGWEKTSLQAVDGVEINPSTVLLTARWSLKTADGQSVVDCALPGWSYVVIRNAETWRVLSEFETPCAD